MNIYVLASGSKGNVAIVENDNKKVLIDCGISYRRLNDKVKEFNLKLSKINHLLITHEHSDHIIGLKMLLKYGNITHVYMTRGTFEVLKDDIKKMISDVELVIIKSYERFSLFNLEIIPFPTSHDANEPIGFVVNNEFKKAVFLTDTGYVDRGLYEMLANADFYLVEANHDPELLLNSRRPFALKQRIMGIDGHLSNEEAAILMNQLITNKKATWVVAHISEDCNTEYLIEKAIVDHFDNPMKIEVVYSSQESLSKIEL